MVGRSAAAKLDAKPRDLQQEILQRERELGMKPILQSFTGHVPHHFQKHFPASKLKTTTGKTDLPILIYWILKTRFLPKLAASLLNPTRLYGTDHLYSADTFNENEPPTNDTTYLSALSSRVYQAMSNAAQKHVGNAGLAFLQRQEILERPTDQDATARSLPVKDT